MTTKAHGTGMGLAISRSIVESHRGRFMGDRQQRTRRDLLFTLPSEPAQDIH